MSSTEESGDVPGFLIPYDAIDLHEVQRILIVKFRNLGDVLLTSPIVTVLRRELSTESKIDAIVYKDTAPMLEGNPGINHIYGVTRGRSGILSMLENINNLWRIYFNRYDLIINLTEGDRGAIISLFSGAQYRVGLEHINQNKYWKRKAYTHWYRTDHSRRHAVEQGLDALRRIGVHVSHNSEPLVMSTPKAAYNFIYHKLKRLGWKGNDYIVVHMTSRWFFKCLAPEQMARLIEIIAQYGWDIVITSGADAREREMLNLVLSLSSVELIDLGGKLELKELAALIDNAKMIAGTDSVAIHIAAALKTPVLTWFGPSNEDVWRPWMVHNNIIKSDLICRPCGMDGCGGGKISECLWGIDNNDIAEHVHNFIASVRR